MGPHRDRDGELVDDGLDLEPYDRRPPHRCDRGWLGEDDQGRPRPCPECKAHLIRRPSFATLRGDTR